MDAYIKELTSVLIAVVDSDSSAKDAYVQSDSEVSRKEGSVWTVLFEHLLSLQENTLGSATVGLLGLVDHEGVVLQVVEDNELSDSVVLKSGFDYALLEIAEKS